MTLIYYKAVRPDGKSFHPGVFGGDWITWPLGATVRHPLLESFRGADVEEVYRYARATADYGAARPGRYLSATVVPTALPGTEWPLRMLQVEPAGPVWTPPGSYPHKRASLAWRVVAELDPMLAIGRFPRSLNTLVERIDENPDLPYELARYLYHRDPIPPEVFRTFDGGDRLADYVRHSTRRRVQVNEEILMAIASQDTGWGRSVYQWFKGEVGIDLPLEEDLT